MSKPIPHPTHVTFYMLLSMIGSKYLVITNPDPFGTGMFATQEAAQQQMLIEIMKSPNQKFAVYPIEWSMPNTTNS